MKPTPSLALRLINGIVLITLTTTLYLSQKDIALFHIKIINSALICLIAYALAAVSINKLLYFPGKQSWLHILPAVGLSYGSVFFISGILFVTFSNSFVLINSLLATLFFVGDFIRRNRHLPNMAYIPHGRAGSAAQIPHARWICLNTPELPQTPVQAVAFDLDGTLCDSACSTSCASSPPYPSPCR